MSITVRFLTTFVIACCLVACDPGSEVRLPGAVSLFGHVDEMLPGFYGRDTVRCAKDARVWLEGTRDTTITDSLGDWRFNGLPVGTYTVTIQKDSFGFDEVFEVYGVGGERSTEPITLLWQDTQFVRIDSVTYDTISGTRMWLQVGDSLKIDAHSPYGVLAVSRSRPQIAKGFDSAEAFALGRWQAGYAKYWPIWPSFINAAYDKPVLAAGDSIYVSFAQCDRNSAVFNPRTNRVEFPSHGRPSNIFGFVLR